MLKMLKEAVLAGLAVHEGTSAAEARAIERRRTKLDGQLAILECAVKLLRSFQADISALRVADGDEFQGTGNCDGHEGVEVTLEWPNLAILADEARSLLDRHTEVDTEKFWYVFFGDCQNPFRCEADDRVEALDIFAEEHPGVSAYVVVPANEQGNLVLEYYGEDVVHCPKCGGRTDFNELPAQGYQAHSCLRCSHNFVAVPDEDEVLQEGSRVAEGVGEVIADIAFTAGHLMGTGRLVAFPDSREMMGNIIHWANLFESVFNMDAHGDDYMELVDDYASYRLTGEHDKADALLADMAARVAA